MTKSDYLHHVLTKNYYRKLKWFFNLFTIQVDGVINSNIKIEGNKAFVKVDNEFILIDWYVPFKPLLTMNDTVTVKPEAFKNLDKEIKTTTGRALVNKILYSDPFGSKIPFLNNETSVGKMENVIAKGLSDKSILVSEYKIWMEHITYISMISPITNISATEKNLLPPKGIEKYKKQVSDELTKEYGEDWIRDRSKVVIFENKLKDFDTEYLKGDPSLGTFVSGKVKNGARVKMFLTFGSEVAFDKKSGAGKLVYPSLLEGYPKDPENLTNMFNTSRSGSYDRGANTQKGGSAAKEELRATASIKIVDNDCGAKVGKTVFVGYHNYEQLEGRHIIVNGKVSIINDPKPYIGKYIELRSPQYCREKDSSLCGVCSGESLRKYPNGVSIIMTDVSAILLATSMSAMHFKELKNIEFVITETIR